MRILTEFPIYMVEDTVMYKGRQTEMTYAMEQVLCDGRNYEHTHGSVHGTRLELLFQLYSTWKIVLTEYKNNLNKEVSLFHIY